LESESREKSEAILVKDQIFKLREFENEQELEDLVSSISDYVFG
jgi:hypothetical protein